MTYRSFRRDRHTNNGVHLTYSSADLNERHLHISRQLRNKYKINIIIERSGWTSELFETYYYPYTHSVVVINYRFKCLEPKVPITTSLKYCGRGQVYDYYLKYVDSAIQDSNITWRKC